MTAMVFFAIFCTTTVFGQTLTEVILPQYIQGLNGTNSTRIPFAYRVTLSGLTANATYRYFNQIIISSDAATTNGAGNVIFATTSGSFTRTTSPVMTTAGSYNEFTTDASGNYTGWFVNEPTGNARFTPGNTVYMRIMLNNGAGGTSVATRLTTTSGVTVINFGTGSTATEGTGIRGSSLAPDKDFVFLYDNESGTGRPIAGTFIESDGTANTTANSYVTFYNDNVNGVSGAWGAIIPNQLANGIRRIEQRSLSSGSIVNFSTDADGNWDGSVNTVNPSGGTTPLVITSTMAPLPVELVSFTAKQIGGKVELQWRTATETNNAGFEIQKSVSNNQSSEKSWTSIGFVEGAGSSNSAKNYSFTDVVPAGAYSYRLKQIDRDGKFNYSNTVEVMISQMPQTFALMQNYPNPFNPSTVISYQLPMNGSVSLKVFDMLGKEIATLVNEEQNAGKYSVSFNAKNLSSGMYFYQLKAGNYSQTQKMILMK